MALWIVTSDPCDKWDRKRKHESAKDRDLRFACEKMARDKRKMEKTERERKFIASIGSSIHSKVDAKYGRAARKWQNDLQFGHGTWVKKGQ